MLATEWSEMGSLNWERIKTLKKALYPVVDGKNALDARKLKMLGYKYIGFDRSLE